MSRADPAQTLARELRLLTQTKAAEPWPLMVATCLRAATAIERLTAEVRRLRNENGIRDEGTMCLTMGVQWTHQYRKKFWRDLEAATDAILARCCGAEGER